MRRTKAAQIYNKTGNLRAVQLLLGHTKLESTVRYLGIEVDDEGVPEVKRDLLAVVAFIDGDGVGFGLT